MAESTSERHTARRFIWANGLQNIGDQIVAPKTVLPWLFNAAGVPALFTSLLVPIREAGSMLPQAALSPWVTSQRSRKRVWLIGSWGQAIAAALIALAAWLFDAWPLGLITLTHVSAPVANSAPNVQRDSSAGRSVRPAPIARVNAPASAVALPVI